MAGVTPEQLRQLQEIGNMPRPFIDNHQFAGYRPPEHPTNSSTFEQVKARLAAIKNTAQTLDIPWRFPLPWELDANSREPPRLYSSNLEQMVFKINFLRASLGYKTLEENANLEYRRGAPVSQYCQVEEMKDPLRYQLAELETQYKLEKAEMAFREDMLNWAQGVGVDAEYEKCWWVDEKARKTKTVQMRQLAEQGSALSAQTFEEIKEERSLTTRNPALTQGVITAHDNLAMDREFFLKALSNSMPKTDAEVFLWYKYLIRERPKVFDATYSNDYARLFFRLGEGALTGRVRNPDAAAAAREAGVAQDEQEAMDAEPGEERQEEGVAEDEEREAVKGMKQMGGGTGDAPNVAERLVNGLLSGIKALSAQVESRSDALAADLKKIQQDNAEVREKQAAREAFRKRRQAESDAHLERIREEKRRREADEAAKSAKLKKEDELRKTALARHQKQRPKGMPELEPHSGKEDDDDDDPAALAQREAAARKQAAKPTRAEKEAMLKKADPKLYEKLVAENAGKIPGATLNAQLRKLGK
jgi:hypothetical protein